MSAVQQDLFTAVVNAYAGGQPVENRDLYQAVAASVGVAPDEALRREPVGDDASLHSLFARKVRWYQQTLKGAGVIERVEGVRGLWRMAEPANDALSKVSPGVSVVGFSTELGVAILGTCESVFSRIDAPITLCLTSPPYPLRQQRRYGNVSESQYVGWVCKTIEPVVRQLAPGGSICLNVSNDIFCERSPARSLYVERLTLALHDRLGLHKMDTLIWENRSKPPGPIAWASKKRVQLNVSYEPILWLTNDPLKVMSDNRRVLQAHTERHLALIKAGGDQRDKVFSDGAYRLKPGAFGRQTEGRIPKNILSFGHACADQRAYKVAVREAGLPEHGAPMPLKLAGFLIEFLSMPGDLIVDPFGGSFTTAKAADLLGRRWLSTECILEYVIGAASRFRDRPGYQFGAAA